MKSRFFDLEGRFNRLAGMLRDQEDMDAELWRRWNARWDRLTELWNEMYETVPPLLMYGNDYRQEPVWPPKWRR